MGIVLAILKLLNVDRFLSLGIPMILENGRWVDGQPAAWYNSYGEVISLIAFTILCWYVYAHAKKAK